MEVRKNNFHVDTAIYLSAEVIRRKGMKLFAFKINKRERNSSKCEIMISKKPSEFD